MEHYVSVIYIKEETDFWIGKCAAQHLLKG